MVTVFSALVVGGCTCVDLGGFHPYACDVDAPDAQCPGDGVCGLEGVCHARGDQQPWRCQDDSHCEGSWRCGPEKVCLDPGREALLPGDNSPLTAARIGRLLPDGLPSHVAGSNNEVFLPVPTCNGYGPLVGNYQVPEHPARVISLTLDGGLYTVVKWSSGRASLPDGGFPTLADCAAYPEGEGPLFRTLDVVRVPAPPVRDLAFYEDTTYVLGAQGVVCRFPLDHLLGVDPGGDCFGMFTSDPAPQRLRLSDQHLTTWPLLVGLGPEVFQVHQLQTGETGPVQRVHSLDGGLLKINDAIAYGHSTPMVLAATPRGLYVRRLDGVSIQSGESLKVDEWEAATGGNVLCEADPNATLLAEAPNEPLRFTASNSGALLNLHYREHREDGSFQDLVGSYFAVDGGFAWDPPAGCVHPPSPLTTPSYPQVLMQWTGCQPCPRNSTLRWFWNAIDGYTPVEVHKLEAQCSNPDGGADLAAVDPTGSCSPFKDWDLGAGLNEPLHGARYQRPVVVDTSSVASLTVVDDLGHQWQPEYSWALQPWTLDRAPAVLFWNQGVNALRGRETHGRENGVPLTLMDPLNFVEAPQGYVREPDDLEILAGIEGRPRWLLVRAQEEGGTQLTGVLETLEPALPGGAQRRALARLPIAPVFGPPYLSTTATSSTGRTVLLLASGDTLLAVDLTGQLAAPAPADFSVADFFSTPEPAVKFTAVLHAPVQSLTTLAAPTAPEAVPRYVEGYLVQAYRLFHFTAANSNVWRTEEVILADNTEPLAVFADGVRARVGMKNGTVYSLPSLLVLAPPLPESALPVTQYLQHCGQLFAVAADGVRRLTAGTGPTGTWEAVTVPGDYRYTEARLFAHGEELRLFTSEGVALQLSGFQCRAPAQ